MFKEIFLFEINYRLKKLSTYIYGIIFFLLGYVIVGGATGLFSSVNVSFGIGNADKMVYNSPIFNHMIISIITLMGIFIVAALLGNTINRDFEHKTFALFFTKPITKFQYLMGRFLGNIVILTGIFLLSAFGMYLVSVSPWINSSYFGEFKLMSYLMPFIVSVIPNIIFSGSIFFALIIYTRKMLSVYVGGILLFTGYIIAGNLFSQIEYKTLASLLDPFGLTATSYMTEHWTIVEQNSKLITPTGLLLFNRLIWVSVGILIFAFSYYKFSFSYFLKSSPTKKKKLKNNEETEKVPISSGIPQVTQKYTFYQSFKQMLSFTKLEIIGIIKHPQFIAITLAGLIVVAVSLSQAGKIYSTPVKPVTYTILMMINGSFKLMGLILIIIYSGELIWRERETKIDQLFDSSPIKNWVLQIPKLIAVISVPLILFILSCLMGIIMQFSKGFDNIDLMQYFTELGFIMIHLFLFSVFAFFIHTIVNNKYLGHFFIIGAFMLISYSSTFGINHDLLRFAKGGSTIYSDMNGYGNFLEKYLWYRLYWVIFSTILLTIAFLFQVRGNEDSVKQRLKELRLRFNPKMQIWSAIILLSFIGTGSYIFYNTNILKEYVTQKESIKRMVEYEQKYKQYKGLNQPRITDVNLHVDLFPEIQEGNFKGSMILTNKSDEEISNLHYELNKHLIIKSISFSKPSTEKLADKKFGYYIREFDTPLKPGETLEMNFDFYQKRKNFDATTKIVSNGTFTNSMAFLPNIGYSGGNEISSEKLRKKHNLPPKERMASVTDEKARMNHYISNCSDWVNYEATVSTSQNQVAMTSGYLLKEWVENDRRYFHYKMDHPILCFFPFVSADYKIKKDKWIGKDGSEVKIEIYFDEKHPYNIDKMIKALKVGLDYYTVNFGQYTERQVRVLEFPRYSAYAQSFPNTIPFSESIGFVADVHEDDLDYPFWVTAHELAHQWWAHQVIGGNVQGAVMLSEVFAQYSSLMALEKEYGKEYVSKFLRHELNIYLTGRANEAKKELPVYKVENQQYIHYNKGAIIMYAMQDYIGEDAVNRSLKNLLESTKWQEPPYTNSLEYLAFLRAETPDSLQYLVTDMFEKITLFDNKMKEFDVEKLDNGKYQVNLEFEAKKVYADSLGNETITDLNDWIDIGIFTTKHINGEKVRVPIYLKKHKITEQKNTFSIIVDEKPKSAGIDPYFKLIDKKAYDNIKGDDLDLTTTSMQAVVEE